jgi:hypothetical protein
MVMRVLSWLSVCVLALSIGCGGGDDGGGGGAADGGTGSPDATPGTTHTVTWGPVEVGAGEENTKCVLVRLGNANQIRVNAIHNVLGDVSHHFIVYRDNLATDERVTPYDCQPFSDTLNPDNGAPITVTQRADETVTLPQGVAFTFGADQMIRLELHYINASDTAKTVMATSTFIEIPETEFQYEADFLFMGDINIDIAPMSNYSLGPTYIPLPADLAGANFFAITGHEHQWGTNVTVEASSGDQAGTMVYAPSNFNWDEPDTVYHDPPFQVPNNGGFRITCDWYNGSNSNVGFGEGANDEMCFFWTYYYPSKGARVCFAHSGFNINACCPGNPTLCNQLTGN